MFPDLTRDDVFRLETGRLWLRWPRHADRAAILRHAGEKAVAGMTARLPHPYLPTEAERFVLEARQRNADGAGLRLAIAPKGKPATLIGMVGIEPDEHGAAHLGYWLGRAAWGCGYATEAARAIIDAFFAFTPARELTSAAHVDNPASRRVLEKCGFAFTGSDAMAAPARGGTIPVHRFHLDRGAWAGFGSGLAARSGTAGATAPALP